MFKLYDYQCQACFHSFEELFEEGDPETIPCPQCMGNASRELFCNDPSAIKAQINPARQREIMQKGAEMRNKILGKTPWRKSSFSQSGNE